MAVKFYLPMYLKGAGAITGPSSRLSRHSELSSILAWLCGNPINFKGLKNAFKFGSALHFQWLQKKKGNWKLTAIERRKIIRCLEELNANKVTVWLVTDAVVEKRKHCKLNGVRMGFTADAAKMKHKIGSDLKTTAARTQSDFEKKAFDYGYFRQGKTYSVPLGLKEFYIYGIMKEEPHTIFIIHLQDDKWIEHMKYVEKELEFLLYFRKHYGIPKWKYKPK